MSPARKWFDKRLAARKPNPPRGETLPNPTKKPRSNFLEMLASAGKQSRPTNWPGFALEGKPPRPGRFIRGSGTLLWFMAAGLLAVTLPRSLSAASLETPFVRLALNAGTGGYEIRDRLAAVTWHSNPFAARFGEVTLRVGGKSQTVPLGKCEVQAANGQIEAVFQPLASQAADQLRVRIRVLEDQKTLEFAYTADPGLLVEQVRLLDDALWTTDAGKGYVTVPVRLGLLIPADSGLTFHQRFDTFAYEGCHMEMLGVVRNGAAALITWHDPYVAAEIKSTVTSAPWLEGQQALSTSLVLRKSAHSFRITVLGRGDYVAIAQAYRQVAREKGWRVTWAEKLEGHPDRAKLFGAINYKLWSLLTRKMSADSRTELSLRTNWTFREAAQIAEHLKHDLKLDKVLFTLGGWIHRGYDNQHPDILPTAPECGGDRAFADCARRVMDLGYLFCLHDNYQDMYVDAPSWDESFINRNPDGQLTGGGHWAGGRAYITCSQRALELAQRPQNLPAVKQLCGANAYFIDTTYAAGLYECFAPAHPQTRADDLKWKQALSDYARGLFGVFGSECGREWAVPHSDFFEGMTGVSGRFYHNKALPESVGGVVVPLFEMVYRDGIALYGKYGYDLAHSAEYVLHHLSLGRPMHYHSIPSHRYWQDESAAGSALAPLDLRPAVAVLQPADARRFRIAYRWQVGKPPAKDWRVFVHFTDAAGNLKFQNDHAPKLPSSQWPVGEHLEGPFTVTVPEGLQGVFEVRMGLFDTPDGQRAPLVGARDGARSQLLGRLTVGSQLAFEPVTAPGVATARQDTALFTRADGGWAEGLHPLDRFVKNTYELLSPLNELTAQMPLTGHEFLTADRKVQRTVFGHGRDQVEVVVNAGDAERRRTAKLGGDVRLPPYGFVVEAPTFVAFHASSWNGVRYAQPVFFTLRSLDGQPLGQSGKVRVYHGFGEAQIKVGDAVRTVKREAVF